MTGALVLEQLRSGPKSTSELVEAAGVSRNAVLCSIWYLDRAGHAIVNDRPRGGRSEGLYRLTYDREQPAARTCLWPSCSKKLNHYNSGPYCLNHRAQLARLMLLCLDAEIDRLLEVAEEHDQLSLV